MPRASRGGVRRIRRSSAAGAAALLVLGVAGGSPLAAHTLALSRGTVDVDRRHVTVTVEIPLGDLMHGHVAETRLEEPSMLALTRAVEEFEARLRDQIVLRDAAGERLRERSQSRIVGPHAMPGDESGRWRELTAVYRFEYPAGGELRYLTLQYLPDGAGPLPLRQLVLAVRSCGADAAHTVRLTAGGNVETLAFDWNDAGAQPVAQPVAIGACGLDPGERLKSVQSVLRIGENEVRLDLFVPLGILETWLPVPRGDHDFVEAAEQRDVRQRLEEFFRHQADLRIDGRPVEAATATVAFLDLDEEEIEPAENARRIGAWTARVAASLRYPAAAPRHLTVDWRMFNSLVLTANAVVRDGERCVAHRFSTYQPRYVWSRGTDP